MESGKERMGLEWGKTNKKQELCPYLAIVLRSEK